MKKLYVAIMGLGTVGRGTYDNIVDAHDKILAVEGLDVEVKKVLDRDETRFVGLPKGVGTTSVDEVMEDKDVSIVVETMGGVEPAKTFIKRAFESGKSVVSANKELIAKHFEELMECAERNGVGFYFEASCVGAVPVMRVLHESVQFDKVHAMYGIINGTTNYILTKMSKEGLEYGDALKQAQQLGYAEFNPEADVEGYDAGYKLAILSSIAYGKRVCFDMASCHGITKITKEQIDLAAKAGYAIKLIAESSFDGYEVSFTVHPMAVRNSVALSSVDGAMNGIFLRCEYAGDMMLYGFGAGARQTGSAILSDILYCAKKNEHVHYNLKEKARVREDKSFNRLIIVENYDAAEKDELLGGLLYEKKELGGLVALVTDKISDKAWKNLKNRFKNMKIVCQFEALL